MTPARTTYPSSTSLRTSSRRPTRAGRPRHTVAERPRTQDDLKIAQSLLMRLRHEMGGDLPVRAAVPATHADSDLEVLPAPEGPTIRIPPIARAAEADQEVSAAGATAFDRALDRLLDEMLGEPGSDATVDRPSRRAG